MNLTLQTIAFVLINLIENVNQNYQQICQFQMNATRTKNNMNIIKFMNKNKMIKRDKVFSKMKMLIFNKIIYNQGI